MKVNEMSDKDKFTCFMQGLKPKTRVELVIKGVTNLEEAIIMATSIEHARFSGKKEYSSVNYANTNKKPFNKKKSNAELKKERIKTLQCYRCNKTGHISKTCRVKMEKKDQIKNQQVYNKPNDEKKKITCYTCKKTGHYSNECRSAMKKGPTTLSNVVQVNYTRLKIEPDYYSESDEEEYYSSGEEIFERDEQIIPYTYKECWDKYNNDITIIKYEKVRAYCEKCLAHNKERNQDVQRPALCQECSIGFMDRLNIPYINATELDLWDELYYTHKEDVWFEPIWFTTQIDIKNERTIRIFPDLIDHLLDNESQLISTEQLAQYKKLNPNSCNVTQVLSLNEENCKLLSVIGRISGVALKCGLDTGATQSIMSHQTAAKYGFKILGSNKKIKTANNMISRVIGKTEVLDLEINKSVASLSFVIIEHEDHDILLGLDWFAQTNVGFYPNEKILKFPCDPKYLNEMDDEDTIDLFIAEEHDEIDIEGETSWILDAKYEIKPGEGLTQQEHKLFMELAKKLETYLAKNIGELGKCNIIKHKINTIDQIPIYVPPYRKSQAERDEIKLQIEELLSAGIIRRSVSP